MSKPYSGEIVQVNYLEVDELEVKCWIVKHQCVGYMKNVNMEIHPKEVGKSLTLKIDRIDPSGDIYLKRYSVSVEEL